LKHNGARLLVDCLIKHKVKYIFGIPGAKIDSVFEALRESKQVIQLIVCRHEQNAAFMAAMWGRLTGEPGVVMVTSGPGVTNLTTGLLTATTEGDPIIAIGANVPRNMQLKQTHQSLDNVSVMRPVTKNSVPVHVPDNIPEAIENAFRTAKVGRPGAVFISIPQDVLLEETSLYAYDPATAIQYGNADNESIKQAANLLEKAQFPVILLGMQASQLHNAETIRSFLNHTKFPVVCTFQAAGIVSKSLFECYMGRVGLFKNQPGDQILDSADVVLTIGYDAVEYDPEVWNNYNSQKKIIDLNELPADIHNHYIPTIGLIGDISGTLEILKQHLKPAHRLRHAQKFKQLHNILVDKISEGEHLNGDLIHPLRFIYDLKKCTDDKTTIICDVGSHYIWLARYFISYQPRHLLFSNGQQTLGVALPWAIAAKLVRPNEKIISISGDGGFLFSAMELETAVRKKVHFVHCIWRDGSYNMVLEQQRIKYQHESGVYFGPIDVVKFAESFGAKGYSLTKTDQLLPTLKEALKQSGPVLIDIPIDYKDNPELFLQIDEKSNH